MNTRSALVALIALIVLSLAAAAHARWYNAETGTFLTRDSAGYVDGLNLYAYVGDRPIGQRDPMGLCGGACTDAAIVSHPFDCLVGTFDMCASCCANNYSDGTVNCITGYARQTQRCDQIQDPMEQTACYTEAYQWLSSCYNSANRRLVGCLNICRTNFFPAIPPISTGSGGNCDRVTGAAACVGCCATNYEAGIQDCDREFLNSREACTTPQCLQQAFNDWNTCMHGEYDEYNNCVGRCGLDSLRLRLANIGSGTTVGGY